MKKDYQKPIAEEFNVLLENRFLDGSWLVQGGQGNFNYTVEEDDEFAY